MTCPVCGKEAPCTHDRRNAAILIEQKKDLEPMSAGEAPGNPTSRDPNWRKEVASRVHQHRARRRRPGETDLAMEFDFPPEEALTVTEEPVVRDRMYRRLAVSSFLSDEFADVANQQKQHHGSLDSPKIIRFPRSLAATASEPALDVQPLPEMMEPVSELPPRIVDVLEQESEYTDSDPTPPHPTSLHQAEQMELLPSFDDIHLEAAHIRTEIETEVIPRPAPLQQRLIAALVDLAAVISAAALFDFTFTRLAEDDPRSKLALLFGLVVSGALWVLFQYLFLVHGEGTPGMRFAQLELSTFEGKPVTAHVRRWRAAASTLSAMSIGLGYAWALVDEDRLGWHDRITRTLLHSSAEPPTRSQEVWTDFIGGI